MVAAAVTFAVVNTIPRVDQDGERRWRVAVAQVGDSSAYLLRDGA